MADVSLVNITKSYDNENFAVKDVNIEIKDKEFVVLVGPSGCGKSTTLRMVAGLEEITSGDLFIAGERVNDTIPKERDIAMVFQNYALYPHMTVFDNMAFGLKLRKISKEEIETRVNEAAEILDIKEYLHRKPKALSGGQRQRVAVGRAIVRKPKVFLFDEPLSNLDAKLRVQMRTEIAKLHKRLEATIIYVTHDQTEAMTMGDRIVVMKDGFVQQNDKPIDVYNKPNNRFVASFIGSPAMNFIDGKIRKNEDIYFESTEGNLNLTLNKDLMVQLNEYVDQNVTLGIRPETMEVCSEQDLNYDLNVELEVVETMGNELFVYFQLGSSQFIARIPTMYNVSAGDELKLKIDKEKIKLFNHTSSNVISL